MSAAFGLGGASRGETVAAYARRRPLFLALLSKEQAIVIPLIPCSSLRVEPPPRARRVRRPPRPLSRVARRRLGLARRRGITAPSPGINVDNPIASATGRSRSNAAASFRPRRASGLAAYASGGLPYDQIPLVRSLDLRTALGILILAPRFRAVQLGHARFPPPSASPLFLPGSSSNLPIVIGTIFGGGCCTCRVGGRLPRDRLPALAYIPARGPQDGAGRRPRPRRGGGLRAKPRLEGQPRVVRTHGFDGPIVQGGSTARLGASRRRTAAGWDPLGGARTRRLPALSERAPHARQESETFGPRRERTRAGGLSFLTGGGQSLASGGR